MVARLEDAIPPGLAIFELLLKKFSTLQLTFYMIFSHHFRHRYEPTMSVGCFGGISDQ